METSSAVTYSAADRWSIGPRASRCGQAGLDRRGSPECDRLTGGLDPERAGADRPQARLVARSARLTSYFCYDSIHEDVCQRLYSRADIRANPSWDRLVGEWPGMPYVKPFYRPGRQTRRNNSFGYLKADWSVSAGTSLSLGGYSRRNRGRGVWRPPYTADVIGDSGGPESELIGGPPVQDGSPFGLIRFVSPDSAAVGAMAG